ncbi:MAG: GerMN domain-containing protein [Synergistaceae bacterium]|jgi:hypothetical protein|nr:GerMN domain-containing protein [Synergistaceae bacterium]
MDRSGDNKRSGRRAVKITKDSTEDAQRTVQRRMAQRRKRPKEKAPIMFRVLVWCGVIMLCFVGGYVGTSFMLDRFMNRQSLLDADSVKASAAKASASDDYAPVLGDMKAQKVTLFYPKNDALMEEKADFIAVTREDSIQDAVTKLLSLCGMFGGDVTLRHVFRNVDTVYLDFYGPFVAGLADAGERASALFITGIVRTMMENFSPITKVRFLVDSKLVTAGAPVDLAATWQLPK